jgi:hypothetical protein
MMAKYGALTTLRVCLQGLKNLSTLTWLTCYRYLFSGYVILCRLLLRDAEDNYQPDGTRLSSYIFVCFAVAAMCNSAVRHDVNDKNHNRYL